MTIFEGIAAVIGAIGLLSWVGAVISDYIKTKSNEKIKQIEQQDEAEKTEIKNLNEEITILVDKINNLKKEVDEFRRLYNEERENKIKAQQQLATINVAFDIIYSQLKRILGDDEGNSELLKQLKKYIDSGTGNITS